LREEIRRREEAPAGVFGVEKKKNDIMEMTPQEKQEYLSRKKIEEKRREEEEKNKKDMKTLVIDRKMPLALAYLENKQFRQD
jgi:hypothetical protein